jgi:hypothetical protein
MIRKIRLKKAWPEFLVTPFTFEKVLPLISLMTLILNGKDFATNCANYANRLKVF